jgi:hypothetical protein
MTRSQIERPLSAPDVELGKGAAPADGRHKDGRPLQAFADSLHDFEHSVPGRRYKSRQPIRARSSLVDTP